MFYLTCLKFCVPAINKSELSGNDISKIIQENQSQANKLPELKNQKAISTCKGYRQRIE